MTVGVVAEVVHFKNVSLGDKRSALGSIESTGCSTFADWAWLTFIWDVASHLDRLLSPPCQNPMDNGTAPKGAYAQG